MSGATSTLPAAPATALASQKRPLASLPVVASLLAVLGGVVAAGLFGAPQVPAENSVEVGFARDMSAHHAQAVAMAETLRDRTDDAELRSLAADIALTQQAQIGMMQAWMDDWGVTPSGGGPRMAWMGEPTDGLMPGMATAEELELLRSLPVPAAEVQFLRLMIPHHAAGVAMAEAGRAMAEDPQVRALADSIAAGQTAELEYLQSLLAARGEPTADAVVPASHDMSGDHHGGGGPTSRDTLLLTAVAIGTAAFSWLLLDTLSHRLAWPRRAVSTTTALLALAALVTGAVHLVLTPAHAEERVLFGLFFVFSAVVALAGAAMAVVRPHAGAVVVGGLSALLIAVYLLFRVVPPPGASTPEGVDDWGVVALLAEAVGVVLAVLVLRPRAHRMTAADGRGHRARPRRRTAA